MVLIRTKSDDGKWFFWSHVSQRSNSKLEFGRSLVPLKQITVIGNMVLLVVLRTLCGPMVLFGPFMVPTGGPISSLLFAANIELVTGNSSLQFIIVTGIWTKFGAIEANNCHR